MTRIKVINFLHVIPAYHNMDLLSNCCVAVLSFEIVSLGKRKTSASSLALVVSASRTDVKTSLGSKEIRRLGVLVKIYCS